MAAKTVTFTISVRRDDGVTVSREVTIQRSAYGPTYRGESQTKFAERVKRELSKATNAVLNVKDDVKVTSG